MKRDFPKSIIKYKEFIENQIYYVLNTSISFV